MKTRKKLAAVVLASILAVTLLAGAGTYAFLSDSFVSSGYSVQAGKLTLDSLRQDLPIHGPMYYTSDNSVEGVKRADGLWKPNMTRVKAMLIENTGTAEGVLQNIKANIKPNAEAYAEDEIEGFMKDMLIGISYLTASDKSQVAAIADALQNAQAELDQKAGEGKKLSNDEIRAIYDRHLSGIQIDVGSNGGWNLRDLHPFISFKPLATVVDGVDVSAANVVLKPGETLFLIYTANLSETNAPQNYLNGRTFEFDFDHYFKQKAPAAAQ